jgi:hypothetical protein
MISIQHFNEAAAEWGLARLSADLGQVKQACSGRHTALTNIDETCLRGLLCGYSLTKLRSPSIEISLGYELICREGCMSK